LFKQKREEREGKRYVLLYCESRVIYREWENTVIYWIIFVLFSSHSLLLSYFFLCFSLCSKMLSVIYWKVFFIVSITETIFTLMPLVLSHTFTLFLCHSLSWTMRCVRNDISGIDCWHGGNWILRNCWWQWESKSLLSFFFLTKCFFRLSLSVSFNKHFLLMLILKNESMNEKKLILFSKNALGNPIIH
jgi:hypothetical protein